jgi:hypothetical protein
MVYTLSGGPPPPSEVFLLSPVHVLHILHILNNIYYKQTVKYGDGIVIYFSSRERKQQIKFRGLQAK